MIVAIGTNDTLASPGMQLDYYGSVLKKMGRAKVDRFARLYVLPQTGHGLTGSNHESKPIPSTFDRVTMLADWVEKGIAPGKSVKVTAGGRSLPMCSYPDYRKYVKGPFTAAEPYRCRAR
jgi:Tannase and feruloyl esterase